MCSVLFRDGVSADSSMSRDDLLEQIWEEGAAMRARGDENGEMVNSRLHTRMVKGVSQSYGTSRSHWTNELASYCAARHGCRVGGELSFATAVPASCAVKRTEVSPKKSVFKNPDK